MAELGLMKEAAEKLINQYHAKAPFIKQLMQAVSRRADESGRIRTLGGRVCHFDLWEPTTFGTGLPKKHADALKEYGPGIKRSFTYKALNRLIQGSAADMTKQSLIRLYENGIIPHIQIHDEVDISVESPEHAKQIVKIMEDAIKLEIPNKVDYESGDNWGDIK
jgi:DNA polymerase I-like protein with 3'-5' exonuclease and polymerase domains